MEIQSVLNAFGALSQESRLNVFRLLVQRGPDGLAAGTIASQLGITPATMSHHLEQLSQAGLVSSRREGRSIIYSAKYETMQSLISFLMENCCEGKIDCCNETTTCKEITAYNGTKQKAMKVIFACVHNAGRSQMAASFFNLYCNQAKAFALSAGTNPGTSVHAEVLAVMKEEGIDLSNVKPQLLTDRLAEDAEILITMGCGETCPMIPGLKRADWALQDPKEQPLERVREIRDEVKQLVQNLVKELGVANNSYKQKVTANGQ
jgi:arsenate reductase